MATRNRLFSADSLPSIIQRQSHRSWIQDLILASFVVGVTAMARLALEHFVGSVTPFLLSFPAVIMATLLLGARTGILTAIGCQTLSILFVFPNWFADRGGLVTDVLNLLLSCLSIAGTIWAVAAYRNASSLLRFQCEREVGTLSLLIREMDHRTKNNFQIAATMLGLQARETGDDAARYELDLAAGRLASMASIYRNLTIGTKDAETVNLAVYLTDIVDLLREGMIAGNVNISVTCSPVSIPSQTAMMVGLIVNEWVTNASKYARFAGRGTITVTATMAARDLIVEVIDNGDTSGVILEAGTGSRLITGLAAAIGGQIECRSEDGTRCRLSVPRPNADLWAHGWSKWVDDGAKL